MVIGYWCCGSIVHRAGVFKACARHRQIFTPVTPQLYNISRMPFSASRPRTPSASVLWTTAVPPLHIGVHNLICQVPRQPVQTPGPRRKPRHPTCPAHDQEVDLGFLRHGLGRGPRSALCQSVGSCGPKGECPRVGWRCRCKWRFRTDLLRWTTLGTMGFRAWFHLTMRLT